MLDEELHRLPEKYRAPVVLCYLQSRTNEEAARQLHWPVGTLKTRLVRARALLAVRLARRGVVGVSGLLAVALAEPAATATVPLALLHATVRAAVAFTAGRAAALMVSARVAALTQGVIKAMLLSKLKVATIVLLALGLAGAGAGVWTHETLAGQEAEAQASQLKTPDQLSEAHRERGGVADVPAPPEPAKDRQQPVAFVFDMPITRAELGEYLVERLGAEELQTLINRKIVEEAARRGGVSVTAAEVEAAFDTTLNDLKCNRKEFADRVLRGQHKTLYQWKEDVIRPRLLLEKLCRSRCHITKEEIRQAFQARYNKVDDLAELEEVRQYLEREILQKKYQQEIPRLFNALREQARPRIILQ